MVTEDGYLVAEGGYFSSFYRRCHTMWLVAYCMCSSELRKTMRPSWSKFISISLQYIFIGKYRCLQGEELKQWNEAKVETTFEPHV